MLTVHHLRDALIVVDGQRAPPQGDHMADLLTREQMLERPGSDHTRRPGDGDALHDSTLPLLTLSSTLIHLPNSMFHGSARAEARERPRWARSGSDLLACRPAMPASNQGGIRWVLPLPRWSFAAQLSAPVAPFPRSTPARERTSRRSSPGAMPPRAPVPSRSSAMIRTRPSSPPTAPMATCTGCSTTSRRR